MPNFRQNLYWEEHNFAGGTQTGTDAAIGSLRLRLGSVLIQDHNTPAVFPFPGFAKLYFLCLVAAGAPNGYHLHLHSFDAVDNGDALAIDKDLYQWQKTNATDVPPAQLHLLAAVIKSKQPLKDLAATLSELYRDSSYKLLTATLNNLINGPTPLPDISNLLFNIAGIVGKYLGRVDERPLLCWYQNFTGIGSDGAPWGKTEKRAANRYASLTLSLTVQDNRATAPLQKTEKPRQGSMPLLFPNEQ